MSMSFIPLNQNINPINQTARKENDSVDNTPSAATPDRNAANSSSSVNISESARKFIESDDVQIMNTTKGDKALDFGSFFENPKGPINLDSIPLLLPTETNVKTLQEHLSTVFPGFLQRNDIPEAPSSIKFNSEGALVLPKDYPYNEELKAALAEEPALMKELRTTNALASHVAELKEAAAFNEEYRQATSQAEIDAIINKYRFLFDDHRRTPEIALTFSKDGVLTVTADNKNAV